MKPFIESGLGHLTTLESLLDVEKPVHVYKNLHKSCWSVRQSGIVVLHTNYICLRDCQLRVGVKGRERVLREKRKNVHAYVCGFFCNPKETYAGKLPFAWDVVEYNPYKYKSFVIKSTGEPCKVAKYVDLMIDDDSPVMAQFPS
jgi:hypothetical protein